MVGSLMPAAAATWRVVVPPKPVREKSAAAASITWRRRSLPGSLGGRRFPFPGSDRAPIFSLGPWKLLEIQEVARGSEYLLTTLSRRRQRGNSGGKPVATHRLSGHRLRTHNRTSPPPPPRGRGPVCPFPM